MLAERQSLAGCNCQMVPEACPSVQTRMSRINSVRPLHQRNYASSRC